MNCLFFMFGRVLSIKSDKFEYNIIKTPPLKNVASKNVAIIPTSHHQNVANFQPNYWLYYIVFKGVGNWDIAIVQYRIFLYHAQIKKNAGFSNLDIKANILYSAEAQYMASVAIEPFCLLKSPASGVLNFGSGDVVLAAATWPRARSPGA